MDKKAIIGTVAGLFIAAVFALLWNTFSKGVESQFGDNPAFTAIHTKLDAQTAKIESLSTQITAMDLKFSTTDARIEARQDLIVQQSNAILAAHQ